MLSDSWFFVSATSVASLDSSFGSKPWPACASSFSLLRGGDEFSFSGFESAPASVTPCLSQIFGWSSAPQPSDGGRSTLEDVGPEATFEVSGFLLSLSGSSSAWGRVSVLITSSASLASLSLSELWSPAGRWLWLLLILSLAFLLLLGHPGYMSVREKACYLAC